MSAVVLSPPRARQKSLLLHFPWRIFAQQLEVETLVIQQGTFCVLIIANILTLR